MKKQKIALLLSLFWLIGLAAAFSLPPNVKTGIDHESTHSVLSELFSPGLTIRISGESPEVPGFKADFNFAGFIQSCETIEWLPSHSQYLSPAFFTKSKPLFNVLITFFYFFYTW